MQLKYLKVKHIMVWQTCDNEHTAAASLIVIYELGSIVFLADPIAHTRIYRPFTLFTVTNSKTKYEEEEFFQYQQATLLNCCIFIQLQTDLHNNQWDRITVYMTWKCKLGTSNTNSKTN